jgi:hypothetical protein
MWGPTGLEVPTDSVDLVKQRGCAVDDPPGADALNLYTDMNHEALIGLTVDQARSLFLKAGVSLLEEDLSGVYVLWTEDEQINLEALTSEGIVRSVVIDLEAKSVLKVTLPFGLTPKLGREGVRTLFGQPRESKEEQIAPVLGLRGSLDRFLVRGLIVEVVYSPQSRLLSRVAIFGKDWVSNRGSHVMAATSLACRGLLEVTWRRTCAA